MLTTWWPSLLVGGGLVAGYLLALRFRPGTLPRWTSWRTIAWVAGAPGVAVALSPPVSELAHHDHRYHMGRHLLLGMYVPLALVLGAPLTLLLGSLPRRTQLRLTRMLRSRPVHVVSHPVTAPLLTVVGMFALYLTPLYAVSMARPEVHVLVMAHFVLAGYLYAWAIAGPDPAPRRPGMATRTTVLILTAGAHAFLAKFLYANATDLVAGHGHASTFRAATQWMYTAETSRRSRWPPCFSRGGIAVARCSGPSVDGVVGSEGVACRSCLG